jgi:pantothenate kinase
MFSFKAESWISHKEFKGKYNDFLISINIIQQFIHPYIFIDENTEIKLHYYIQARHAFICVWYIHRKMSYIKSSSNNNNNDNLTIYMLKKTQGGSPINL